LRVRKTKAMADNKRLYFIPIIARALDNESPKRAMVEAFDDITKLGNLSEYKEGFRQFLEFVKAVFKPTDKRAEKTIQMVKNAIHQLTYDLATDTFEGFEQHKEALLTALKSNPVWNAEYERIKEEAQAFRAPETPIEVEILIGEQLLGSYSMSHDEISSSSIVPGWYVIRFSNGRVLWEGELTREDVIWTYAFPGKDMPMAAETDPHIQRPTKTVSLLNGEVIIHVFAGLETGRIILKSGQST